MGREVWTPAHECVQPPAFSCPGWQVRRSSPAVHVSASLCTLHSLTVRPTQGLHSSASGSVAAMGREVWTPAHENVQPPAFSCPGWQVRRSSPAVHVSASLCTLHSLTVRPTQGLHSSASGSVAAMGREVWTPAHECVQPPAFSCPGWQVRRSSPAVHVSASLCTLHSLTVRPTQGLHSSASGSVAAMGREVWTPAHENVQPPAFSCPGWQVRRSSPAVHVSASLCTLHSLTVRPTQGLHSSASGSVAAMGRVRVWYTHSSPDDAPHPQSQVHEPSFSVPCLHIRSCRSSPAVHVVGSVVVYQSPQGRPTRGTHRLHSSAPGLVASIVSVSDVARPSHDIVQLPIPSVPGVQLTVLVRSPSLHVVASVVSQSPYVIVRSVHAVGVWQFDPPPTEQQ